MHFNSVLTLSEWQSRSNWKMKKQKLLYNKIKAINRGEITMNKMNRIFFFYSLICIHNFLREKTVKRKRVSWDKRIGLNIFCSFDKLFLIFCLFHFIVTIFLWKISLTIRTKKQFMLEFWFSNDFQRWTKFCLVRLKINRFYW